MEVGSTVTASETTVTSIEFLHPGEVSFHHARAAWDRRIIKVVEHIRKRMEEHAPRTFQIARNPAALGRLGERGTVACFPRQDVREERVTFGVRLDPHDAQEERTEVLARGSLRIPPAPHEPLALHVDDATLDRDPREDRTECPSETWIPVNGGTLWHQPPISQTTEEGKEVHRDELMHAVRTGEDLVSIAIHHREHARRTPFQERPICNEVRGIAHGMRGHIRWTFQPFMDDALKFPPEVSTLYGELAERVPFLDPEQEPVLLASTSRFRLPPRERSPAGATLETLCARSGASEATDIIRRTRWTSFFSA